MNTNREITVIKGDKQKFRAAGIETLQEETQTMKNLIGNPYTRLSLISITLTAIFTATHHVFRDGVGLLVAWGIIILLPYVLLRWFTQTGNKWSVWSYILYNVMIIVPLGIVDGLLDHVLKALGLLHLTFLPGGDAEVVQTVYSLWSPQAGNVFYEGTGILTFIGSVFATLYLYQFIRALNRGLVAGATEPQHGSGVANI